MTGGNVLTDGFHARCGYCHRLLPKPTIVVSYTGGYGWSFDTLACRSAWFGRWMEARTK